MVYFPVLNVLNSVCICIPTSENPLCTNCKEAVLYPYLQKLKKKIEIALIMDTEKSYEENTTLGI